MMTKTKRASLQEIATFFKVSENTIENWKKKYLAEKYEDQENSYNPHDIQSVFNFFVYCLYQRYDLFKYLLKYDSFRNFTKIHQEKIDTLKGEE